jgi:CBS domain-containing protein
MEKNLVRNWMTAAPITIDAKTNLSVAHHLMRLNNVRRLPVVNNQEKLVGIVTWGDIREARPKQSPSLHRLDAWEERFLAATMEISEIMTPNPVTVAPDMSIRQAVELMLHHKIGGLPVVERGRVVGIITESDIFRFLIDTLPESESEFSINSGL